MSKRTLGKLREKLQAVLNDADLSEFGDMAVSIGQISYTGGEIFPVTLKVEVAKKGDGGIVESRIARDFKNNAGLYGLEPDDLGKTFEQNGETFTIKGLKTRNRKFPIIAENNKGQSYKFGEQMVKLMLRASEGRTEHVYDTGTEHASPIM